MREEERDEEDWNDARPPSRQPPMNGRGDAPAFTSRHAPAGAERSYNLAGPRLMDERGDITAPETIAARSPPFGDQEHQTSCHFSPLEHHAHFNGGRGPPPLQDKQPQEQTRFNGGLDPPPLEVKQPQEQKIGRAHV